MRAGVRIFISIFLLVAIMTTAGCTSSTADDLYGLPKASKEFLQLQKQIDGRMTLMGGIDAAIVDRPDSTEEEIRTETRRVLEEYCTGGHFIPSITYGGPGTIYPQADEFINDEIDKYNKKVFGV